MTQGHERRGAMDMGRRNQGLVGALIKYVVVFGDSKLKIKTENGAFSKFTSFEIALYNS